MITRVIQTSMLGFALTRAAPQGLHDVFANPATATQTRLMQTNVLVIDDDDEMLSFLRRCVEQVFPLAQVTTYDSKRLGRPGVEFDWSRHDVLLLDYNLGNGETGTEWLKAFSDQAAFPPTILLSAEDSPIVVGEAVLSGAGAYLNKATLNRKDLAKTLKDLIESRWVLKTFADVDVPSVQDRDSTQHPELIYRGKNELDTGPGGSSYRFIRLIGRGAMRGSILLNVARTARLWC